MLRVVFYPGHGCSSGCCGHRSGASTLRSGVLIKSWSRVWSAAGFASPPGRWLGGVARSWRGGGRSAGGCEEGAGTCRAAAFCAATIPDLSSRPLCRGRAAHLDAGVTADSAEVVGVLRSGRAAGWCGLWGGTARGFPFRGMRRAAVSRDTTAGNAVPPRLRRHAKTAAPHRCRPSLTVMLATWPGWWRGIAWRRLRAAVCPVRETGGVRVGGDGDAAVTE